MLSFSVLVTNSSGICNMQALTLQAKIAKSRLDFLAFLFSYIKKEMKMYWMDSEISSIGSGISTYYL